MEPPRRRRIKHNVSSWQSTRKLAKINENRWKSMGVDGSQRDVHDIHMWKLVVEID